MLLISKSRHFKMFLGTLMVAMAASTANAQDKRIVEALGISPVFAVEIDTPTKSEIKNCQIKRAQELDPDQPGWIVYDSNGRVLRKLLDRNKDKYLDQWSYYKNGVEVYREVDTDFDEKINEFRWMGTLGTRWGVDKNQDGEIDTWKTISPEEVALEVFEAVKNQDAKRFSRVLITNDEINSLKLGSKMGNLVAVRAKNAVTNFASFTKTQKSATPSAEWMHFGTTQPGLLAAGTDGIKQDVIFYDQASAVFRNKDEFEQLAIGTIVQVGKVWRAIELPQFFVDDKPVENGGVFLPIFDSSGAAASDVAANPMAQKIGELSEEWKKVEAAIDSATKTRDIVRLEEQRFGLMQSFIENTRGEDRQNWMRIMTDTVTDAFQRERFPSGLTKLVAYRADLEKEGVTDLLDYVDWRILSAEFATGLKGDRRARAEATDNYVDAIEQFVKQYPSSEFSPEGMMILATNYEVADIRNPKRAVEWYEKLAAKYPTTDNGKKAKGAILRLTGVGKKIPFTGKTLNGQSFDLAADNLRGKVIVVHYWQDWCDVCKKNFDEFQRIASKYRGKAIVIGANLDDEKTLKDYLAKNKNVNWPQLTAEGGTESSSLAQQLGVSTLPMVILIDQEGRLVDSNVTASDLDREIQRLVSRKDD